MKDVIYYFTGTGNSLALARSFGEKINCREIRAIKHELNSQLPASLERVGIFCPNYAFNIPHMVRYFIRKLAEESRIKYLYLLIDAAGNNGDVVRKMDKLLKQFTRTAIFTTCMPTNYIVFGELFDKKKLTRRLDDAENYLEKIIPVVEAMEEYRESGKNSAGRMTRLMYAITYPLIPYMNRMFKCSDDCNNCGICRDICPTGCISIIDSKPRWKGSCEQCLACLHACPSRAINFGKVTITRGRYRHPDINLKDLTTRDPILSPNELSTLTTGKSRR